MKPRIQCGSRGDGDFVDNDTHATDGDARENEASRKKGSNRANAINCTVAVAHNTPAQNKLIFAGIFNLQYKYLCFMVSSLLRHHHHHRRRLIRFNLLFQIAVFSHLLRLFARFFSACLLGCRFCVLAALEMHEREEQAASESC